MQRIENMLLFLQFLKGFIQEKPELSCEPLVQVTPVDGQWETIQGCTCTHQIQQDLCRVSQ